MTDQRKPKLKWKFAVGTTSRVPDSKLQYLIVDIDNRSGLFLALRYIVGTLRATNVITQPTKRGWHIYTNSRMCWRELLRWLPRVPYVDKQWLKIGERRGYFYLADKDAITFNWPVQRMIIHHGKT
jgi:hypothetical protein